MSAGMYFLSFLPLWAAIVIVDIESLIRNPAAPMTEIISIALILVCLLLSGYRVYRGMHKGKEEAKRFSIREIREQKAVTADYLLSNVLPLLAFDFTQWIQVLVFLIFFVSLGFLHIRHNYFSTNITLELLGYRFFSVELVEKIQSEFSTGELSTSLRTTLISRHHGEADLGSQIDVIKINSQYYVALKERNRK